MVSTSATQVYVSQSHQKNVIKDMNFKSARVITTRIRVNLSYLKRYVKLLQENYHI